MPRHTAYTLAKYARGKFSFKNIKGKQIIGEMTSCDFKLNTVVLFDENEMKGCQSFTYDASRVHPILKTGDDLTGDDLKAIGTSENFRDDVFEMDLCEGYGVRDALVDLIKIQAGAVENKESPTGYVSVHDDLPCVRWEKD